MLVGLGFSILEILKAGKGDGVVMSIANKFLLYWTKYGNAMFFVNCIIRKFYVKFRMGNMECLHVNSLSH